MWGLGILYLSEKHQERTRQLVVASGNASRAMTHYTTITSYMLQFKGHANQTLISLNSWPYKLTFGQYIDMTPFLSSHGPPFCCKISSKLSSKSQSICRRKLGTTLSFVGDGFSREVMFPPTSCSQRQCISEFHQHNASTTRQGYLCLIYLIVACFVRESPARLAGTFSSGWANFVRRAVQAFSLGWGFRYGRSIARSVL